MRINSHQDLNKLQGALKVDALMIYETVGQVIVKMVGPKVLKKYLRISVHDDELFRLPWLSDKLPLQTVTALGLPRTRKC